MNRSHHSGGNTAALHWCNTYYIGCDAGMRLPDGVARECAAEPADTELAGSDHRVT
jgi:hypothetical protein